MTLTVGGVTNDFLGGSNRSADFDALSIDTPANKTVAAALLRHERAVIEALRYVTFALTF